MPRLTGRSVTGLRHRPQQLLGPALLAVLLLGPVLLRRGYVLVGDMTFVPSQPWKSQWLGLDGSVPRAVPADAVVSWLSQIVPGDLLQKAILLGIVVLAGWGMTRLLSGTGTAAQLSAAALYIWNPYVAERLAIGHWGLLIGYAVLPLVVRAALDVRAGDPGAQARLTLWLVPAAVGSPTGGVIASAMALGLLVGPGRWREALRVCLVSVAVNLPWIVPGMLAQRSVSDAAGVDAFAAAGDTPGGPWLSLFTLGGMWKTSVAPPERGVLVVALLGAVLTLVALAGVWSARRDVVSGEHDVAIARLTVIGLGGLLLAGLPTTAWGNQLIGALVANVPGAGLLRDSQKWLLPFVLLISLGLGLAVQRLQRRTVAREFRSGAASAGSWGLVALAPIVLLPSMAWGLTGTLQPVHYPSEWAQVRTVMERAGASTARTAVFPWSAYQRFAWNDSRAVLDPAQRFFPGEVLTNDSLVMSATSTVAGENPASARLSQAIAEGGPLEPALAREGVRFVLQHKTAPGPLPAVTRGVVLHDGPQLRLIELPGHGSPATAPRAFIIVAADVLAVLIVIASAAALCRQRRGTLG